MPRVKLAVTTSVETTVKLQPHVRQMVKARCDEHMNLSRQIKPIKARMKAIDTEVTSLFKKDKQGKALLDGVKFDGHGMKLTIGKRKVFDQMGFMKKHGLTQADFDAFTEYEDNAPYVRFTHPGEKDENDD